MPEVIPNDQCQKRVQTMICFDDDKQENQQDKDYCDNIFCVQFWKIHKSSGIKKLFNTQDNRCIIIVGLNIDSR